MGKGGIFTSRCVVWISRICLLLNSIFDQVILDRYPKERTVLPDAYKRIHLEHYMNNRNRSSAATRLSGYMEGWMHRRVAGIGKKLPGRILEIGAGTLNHVDYEKDYTTYDVVEPFTALYKDAPEVEKINRFYRLLEEVPEANRYDRIISVAVLEHLCELPLIVARACLLMDTNGHFVAGIPSEGHFLWKLAYSVTTGREFKRKYGLDYSVFMEHEHVNTAKEIGAVLCLFFKRTKRKLFGINPALSLYQVWECSEPDMNRALSYIEQQTNRL